MKSESLVVIVLLVGLLSLKYPKLGKILTPLIAILGLDGHLANHRCYYTIIECSAALAEERGSALYALPRRFYGLTP